MNSLSITLLAVWLGCAVHLGHPPASAHYSLMPVTGAVAEPGVTGFVQRAVFDELRVRGASASSDPIGAVPLDVEVVEATWLPAGRTDAGLVYEASLGVQFVGAECRRLVTVRRQVGDPGSAASSLDARRQVFTALAQQAAVQGVSALCPK